MIIINFTLKTNTGKNLEFLQTIGSIIVDLHKANGCINIDLQQDDDVKEQFSLKLNWENKEQLMALFDYKEFEIFLGAIQVLCQPPLINIYDGHKTIIIGSKKSRNNNLIELLRIELMDSENNSKNFKNIKQ